MQPSSISRARLPAFSTDPMPDAGPDAMPDAGPDAMPDAIPPGRGGHLVRALAGLAIAALLAVGTGSSFAQSAAATSASSSGASSGLLSGPLSGASIVGPGPAQPPKAGPSRVDAVEAELVADVAQAVAGEPFRIGLRLAHDPHWHTYWRNPGDSGLPTRFEPTGPAGADYGGITWPAPRRLAIGDLANYGYEGEIVLARPVTLPADFDGTIARFEVFAQWLVCRDVCIPGEAVLALEVPVGRARRPAAAEVTALFDASAARAPVPGAAKQAGWWRDGERALLALPAGLTVRRAEFFPYFEGVVVPAAAQSLHADASAARSADPAGAVLALRTAAPRDGASALPAPAGGLLVADGRPIEVSLAPLAEPPATGTVVSVAEVAPTAPAAAPGLLGRLAGRAGAAFRPQASASPSNAVSAPGVAATLTAPSAAADAGGGFLLALAGALLGGAILNLMPCVFPVIGLKILSFAQAAGGDRRRARRHAASFASGIVLAFAALSGIFLALRAAGTAAGWGFQMQSPLFVGAMALLFVLIALNLFGVFETGLSLTRLADLPVGARPGTAGGGASQGTLGGSFLAGVLAVLVATPCTAPFMGGAVGFTLATTAWQTLAVFLAIGIGMALPYLVLGWLPRLLAWLPRPGPWLGVFRQLLAFPMLATAAWLAWVLALQAGADGLLHLLVAAVLMAFAAWAYGCLQRAPSARTPKAAAAGIVAGLLALAGTAWQLARIDIVADAPVPLATSGSARTGPALAGARSTAPAVGAAAATTQGSAAQWEPWSAGRVARALAEGRPVLVDFTAAWCITCQANKRFVLDREAVRAEFAAQQVVLLRADWTRRDPAISAELARFGRNGVPFYLLYTSPRQPPRVLPELLTVDTVLTALGSLR